MDRRSFLKTTSAAGVAAAFGGFTARSAVAETKGTLEAYRVIGYGELVPTAAKNTGETVLAVPRGFEYTILGKTGDKMSDGRMTPNEHDGMAAFTVDGKIRIVRNHEINDDVPKPNVAIGASNHYDEMAGGGTTTLIVDPRTRLIESDFVSLSGTLNNCAGGPTPWGTWISCEETTHGATKYLDDEDAEVGGFAKPHGYCFEVSAVANTIQPATPLTAMGRFSHEAIAVDAKSGVVYMTEDAKPYCGFYRFIPIRSSRLAEGGVLQQLAIKDKPNYTTQFGQTVGSKFSAIWVTIDNPNTPKSDTDEQAVFKQGARKGACHFNKLEGCWSDANGKIYFVSSSGGDAGGGQIWTYEPKGRDSGILTLVFESPDRDLLDMPDNICKDPNSLNMFLCEDSDYAGMGGTTENYVRILTPNGKVADFARNMTPGNSDSEVAGATFSPDGSTLFFNVQKPGFTVAVWGDWKTFRS
ncbi:MAG: alkaline phosphatase PhoX [Pyrinomonadaceae bacterium]